MSTTIKKQRMEHTIIKQLKVLGIVLGNAKNAAKRDHHQERDHLFKGGMLLEGMGRRGAD